MHLISSVMLTSWGDQGFNYVWGWISGTERGVAYALFPISTWPRSIIITLNEIFVYSLNFLSCIYYVMIPPPSRWQLTICCAYSTLLSYGHAILVFGTLKQLVVVKGWGPGDIPSTGLLGGVIGLNIICIIFSLGYDIIVESAIATIIVSYYTYYSYTVYMWC